jgi:hypothetical protein
MREGEQPFSGVIIGFCSYLVYVLSLKLVEVLSCLGRGLLAFANQADEGGVLWRLFCQAHAREVEPIGAVVALNPPLEFI